MAAHLPVPFAPHDGALRDPERGAWARSRAWLLGLVAGSLGGLLLLVWGIGIPWLGPIAFVVGALVHPRPFGLSGTLVGWGGLWALLLLRADAACDPTSCEGPDLAPWLALSAALILAGLVTLSIVRRRGRLRS